MDILTHQQPTPDVDNGLRRRLVAICAGRDLSPAARAELSRLLVEGTTGEIEEVLAHLRHLPPVVVADIDVCPDTASRFDVLWAEHTERVEAHCRRLGATAYRLGEQVAHYRMTAVDASSRLERLATQNDPSATIPMSLVGWDNARDLVRKAFSRGFNAGRKP